MQNQPNKSLKELLAPKDEMDECLNAWEDAVADWKEAADRFAELDTTFKAWEAARKAAYMAAKVSAVQSEAKVRSEQGWSDRYLESQKANIAAETAKRIVRLAEARWQSEQTRQVSLRALK